MKLGFNPIFEKRNNFSSLDIDHPNHFETIARNWHKSRFSLWTKHHAKNVLDSLEKDVFPFLGQKPIHEITAPMVLSVLKKVEERGAIETAHRIR
ncbi:MAG: tyrosine-type recombinase/integrase [Commensalibacter sp.]